MSARDMQGQYAGFVTRFMAWLIDHGIIVVIIFANTALTRFFGSVLRIDTSTCIDTEIFETLTYAEDFEAELQLERIEGAGHFLHQEKPDECNAVLLDWLMAN